MSKHTKHTKGPWKVEQFHELRLEVAEGTYAVCGKDGKANAFCLGSERTQEANAQLIAAAPELLEFVQMVLDEQKLLGVKGDAFYICTAQKLISKVKGK